MKRLHLPVALVLWTVVSPEAATGRATVICLRHSGNMKRDPLLPEDVRILDELHSFDREAMSYRHIVQTVANRLGLDDAEVEEAILRAVAEDRLDPGTLEQSLPSDA